MIKKTKSGFIIISQTRGWITNFSKDFGKWLTFDKAPGNLVKFKSKLNELVKKGEVEQVKFFNKVEVRKNKIDLLPLREESVLMIYCWQKDKEKVKTLLENLGFNPKEWKSNLQTIKDWGPGGKLYKEMKKTLPKEQFGKIKNQVDLLKYID